MLDAWIIEEIKRKEKELQKEQERPRVEIPAPIPNRRPSRESPTKPVLIDLYDSTLD